MTLVYLQIELTMPESMPPKSVAGAPPTPFTPTNSASPLLMSSYQVKVNQGGETLTATAVDIMKPCDGVQMEVMDRSGQVVTTVQNSSTTLPTPMAKMLLLNAVHV